MIASADSGAPSSAGKVGLTVPGHGKSKLTLVRVGHVSVKVALAFAPAGGTQEPVDHGGAEEG